MSDERQMIGREAACNESVTDCNHLGNAAAMREASEAVVKVGYPHNFQNEAQHIREYCYEITTAIKKCFAALAAPPRNCDVCTEEEQNERHKEWCSRNTTGKCSISCYVCLAKWAQMPYEEGGAK